MMAERIVSIRKGLGLSQRVFANKVGLSVATLRNWEQGLREPTQAGVVLLLLLEKYGTELLGMLEQLRAVERKAGA